MQFYTQKKRVPSNERASKIAPKRIESLSQAAGKKLTNTVNVDGSPSVLYNIATSGRLCTCRSLGLTSFLDEEGHLPSKDMEVLLAGDNIEIRADGKTVAPNGSIPSFSPEDLDVFAKDDGSVPNPPSRDAGITEVFNNRSTCGVCFGLRYVGGYKPYGRHRIVLDTTYPAISVGFFVNEQPLPNAWSSDSIGDSISFNVKLPKMSLALDAFRVFNNIDLVTSGYTLLVSDGSGGWVDQDGLLDVCDGFMHTIKLTTTETGFTFTHIELQLVYDDTLKIDFPRLDEELHVSILDGLVGSSIVIPPTVGSIHRLGIIRELTRNRVWKVSNVREQHDSKKRVYGWECTARLVQEQELQNILPAYPICKKRILQKPIPTTSRNYGIL